MTTTEERIDTARARARELPAMDSRRVQALHELSAASAALKIVATRIALAEAAIAEERDTNRVRLEITKVFT